MKRVKKVQNAKLQQEVFETMAKSGVEAARALQLGTAAA